METVPVSLRSSARDLILEEARGGSTTRSPIETDLDAGDAGSPRPSNRMRYRHPRVTIPERCTLDNTAKRNARRGWRGVAGEAEGSRSNMRTSVVGYVPRRSTLISREPTANCESPGVQTRQRGRRGGRRRDRRRVVTRARRGRIFRSGIKSRLATTTRRGRDSPLPSPPLCSSVLTSERVFAAT